MSAMTARRAAPAQAKAKFAPAANGLLRRKGSGGGAATADAGVAPASVEAVLSGVGQPLAAPVRGDMERRFGHDFSTVRIHAGPEAARSADMVAAQAYTVGRDIVFGPGRYAPETRSGRRLIAHELAHVIQQVGLVGPGSRVIDGAPCLQRDLDQSEEEQRDKDRNRGRIRRARDPFGSFDSDWAGRLLLGHYLYGRGRAVDLRDKPEWTRYMSASEILRKRNKELVIAMGAELALSRKLGRMPTFRRYHGEIENGEGMIGYQYLHGTNKTVGDFLIVGWGEVVPMASEGVAVVPGRNWLVPDIIHHQAGTRVDFELRYIWNDIIDPNGAYISDTIKSGIAEYITLGRAEGYRISIGWRDTCSVFFPTNGRAQIVGGYPAE